MRAEDAATTGPAAYKIAASSAINALVGSQDDGFNAQAPNPGDDAGAIGHVNQLLDRARHAALGAGPARRSGQFPGGRQRAAGRQQGG